jgi:hypothetical protein
MPAVSPLLTVFSGLLTPLIAIIAVSIAWRQWSTARYRLRLDLFDRRLAIHSTALDLIGAVSVSGEVRSRDFVQLLAGTRQARWLLNKKMQAYFDDEMIPKVIRFQSLCSELNGLSDAKSRARNLEAQDELKDWIIQQRAVIDSKFDRYLRMPR